MGLKEDIEVRRREISSDNISMSVGELLNLYKDNELDIHPEFQRVFRWGRQQKSRLIESLLLGIPLPSIYVAANNDGVWEVIDGVQRLSTIFEFMGELVGPKDLDAETYDKKPPLVLIATKHLSALEKMTFEALDHALRLDFKRTRIDIKVLAREQQGVSTGKFDLFERLNTYGATLSPQELRNCVLVSLNVDRFRWLKKLASLASFRSSLLLSETQLLEQYDMDLALRFILLRDAPPSSIGDVHDFLREKMEELATDTTFDADGEARKFGEIFDFIDKSTDGNAFRPWNEKLGTFRGGFSLAAYEGVALALGRHWDEVKRVRSKFDVLEVIKTLWSHSAYKASFSGIRARERMVRVSPAAEEVVAAELARVKTNIVSKPMRKASHTRPKAA